MRVEISPNSVFDGGEKSEATLFSFYQLQGEGDLRVNSSQRAYSDAGCMSCSLLGAMENPERHGMNLGLNEFRI